jgi:hypothetical protein
MTQNCVDDKEIQNFLDRYLPQVQAISLELRKLVFRVVPEAIEQLDLPARMLAYGFDRSYRGMICVVMPLKSAVNFGFPHGVELVDPDGYLEGSGKRARHVKVKDFSLIDLPALLGFVEASAAIAKTALRRTHAAE